MFAFLPIIGKAEKAIIDFDRKCTHCNIGFVFLQI